MAEKSVPHTTAGGFQHGFGLIRASENLGNPLINLYNFSEKFNFSETISHEQRQKNFLRYKIVGPLKNFKTRSGRYLGLQ